MFDIKTASIEELLKDKANAEDSLQFGKLMWQRGIRKVDDMSLAYAISVDEQVIAMIDAELERRAREASVEES